MKKKLSFKYKLIFSFLFFYLLPLLVITIIGYTWISKAVLNEAITSYQTILDKTCKRIDDGFEDLENYTTQLSQRTWMRSLIYMTDRNKSRFDLVDYHNFANEMIAFTISNRLSENAFIYFKNSDIVLSTISSGIDELAWFRQNTFVADLSFEGIDQPPFPLNTEPKYKLLENVASYGRKKTGILCSFSVAKDSAMNSLANMYFFVPQIELALLVQESLAQEANSLVVTDGNQLILNLNASSSMIDSIKQEHLFSLNEQNYHSLAVEDQPYYMIHTSSDKTGWNYYNFIPQTQILNAIGKIQIYLLLGIFLFCIAGYLLSHYMAIRNYRPIQELVDKIMQEQPHEKIKTNELNWLDHAISSILDKEKNLNSQIISQRPILRNAYISWLLNVDNQKNQDQVLRSMELLDVNFQNECFICLLSSLKAGTLLQEDIIILTKKLSIILCLFERAEESVFILNYSYDEQLEAFLNEFSGILRLKGSKYYFGVGESCNDISKLSTSFRQAEISRNFRIVNGLGGLTFFHDITTTDGSYYYPIEKEYAIKNCLKSGDFEAAIEVFEELCIKNSSNPPISLSRVKNFFYNAQFTCLKCIDELEIGQFVHIDIEKIAYCKTIESFKQQITSEYSKICEYINANKKDNNSLFKKDICKFILEHLCEPTLSLATISKEYALSESYISKLFKEQIGINFLDYINRERIELSKKLLLSNAEESIIQLSKEIGYDSDVTFRRIFKKYTGITPTRFREINQK